MKKAAFLLVSIGILLSCDSSDESNSGSDLIGTWNLIEVLADPGDGSGTFQPVDSDKKIDFRVDGVVTTNSSLCDPYSEEIISSGTYKNNTITTNCENPNITTISFKLESQFLILNFISNEGYSQKFEKMD